MNLKEISSEVKNKKKQTNKPTRIQYIKFAIGIVLGITLYLIIQLIF